MKNLTITAITTLLILANLNAFAEDHKTKKKNFAKEHPRRAEVLNRANNEEKQNNEAAEDGKITKKQAQKLDREDQNIKRQEQRDARNRGHKSVKDPALNTENRAFFATSTYAVNDFKSLFPALHKFRDELGVILAVCVELDCGISLAA